METAVQETSMPVTKKSESKGQISTPPETNAETQTNPQGGGGKGPHRVTPSQIHRNSQEVRAIPRTMHIFNPCCCDCGSWNLRICCIIIAVCEFFIYIPYFSWLAVIQKDNDASFSSFVQGTVVELILLWLAVAILVTSIIAGILLLSGVFCRYHPICILHTIFDAIIIVMLIGQIILGVIRYQKESVANCVGISLWALALIFLYIYFAICSYGLSTLIRVGVDKMIPITLPPHHKKRSIGQQQQEYEQQPNQNVTTYQVPVQASYPSSGQPRVVYAPAYPAYAPRYYGYPGTTTSDVLGTVLLHDMLYGHYGHHGYGPYYGGYYGGYYDDYYGGWGGGYDSYYDGDYGGDYGGGYGGYDDFGGGYDGGGMADY